MQLHGVLHLVIVTIWHVVTQGYAKDALQAGCVEKQPKV